ncbi:MAG: hypothetical protein FJ027_10205 [Candidatus Rokubacteria bacterium]|nr:hypothetical protein [Candidatus Rokubacteria bacterium]
MPRRLRRDLVLVSAVLLAVAAGAASAQPARPDTGPRDEARRRLADLARQSSHVVVGKVVKTEARWVKRKIVTAATVEVVETLKGAVAANRPLTIAFLGGRVGALEQDFSHEVTLETGETALLFLSDRAGPGRELRIVADGKDTLLAQGMAASRLRNNRRVAAYLQEAREVVRDAR